MTTQVESSLNPEDNGASGLTRSLSSKSSVSTRSSSASTASSVGTGSKKRVEPMFNLTVHNVMHSTMVTDAATDVKVAKVSELLNLSKQC